MIYAWRIGTACTWTSASRLDQIRVAFHAIPSLANPSHIANPGCTPPTQTTLPPQPGEASRSTVRRCANSPSSQRRRRAVTRPWHRPAPTALPSLHRPPAAALRRRATHDQPGASATRRAWPAPAPWRRRRRSGRWRCHVGAVPPGDGACRQCATSTGPPGEAAGGVEGSATVARPTSAASGRRDVGHAYEAPEAAGSVRLASTGTPRRGIPTTFRDPSASHTDSTQ